MEYASRSRRRYAPSRWRRPFRVAVWLAVTGTVAAGAFTASASTIGHGARHGRSREADEHTGVALAVNDSYRLIDPAYNPRRRLPAVSFLTVDDQADLTFNQLLGINDHGTVGGYFGSGADAKHPNRGYVVRPDYDRDDFTNENFPGSVQTQVVGINNAGTTVGFFVDGKGANVGFVRRQGMFLGVVNPAVTANPPFAQLLGVNNRGVAAGFANDAAGASHGFLYWIDTHRIAPLTLPVKADSVVASGVNDRGVVSGFYTVGKATFAFVLSGQTFVGISLGAKTNTQALGINNENQVVGSFVDAAGAMHGFVWHNGSVRQIDDPYGSKGTVVNGINNRGQLVGFYVDAKGNTNGFIARLRT